jgi:regulator of sirC expression with transglutaminase-like and TPR domain
MLFSRGMAYAVKGGTSSGVDFKDRFELNRALADFDAAIKLRPDAAVAYIHRGMVLMAMGNYERAIADFNQAIAQRDLFVAYYNRGMAYQDRREFDLAIQDFTQTIRLDPKNGLAFNNRGFARLAKGEHDRAIADFGEAIRLDPRDVLPLKHRGEAYWITGDLDRALRDYEAALALAPGDEAAKKAHDAVKAAMGTSTAPQESRSRAVNERRIALVIGNGRYENMARLPNPTNDASDLAGVLKGLGFEVTLGIDLKRGQMEDAAIAFAKAARNADTALVFYAGAGMQHEGINYLAPVDARLDDVADLQRREGPGPDQCRPPRRRVFSYSMRARQRRHQAARVAEARPAARARRRKGRRHPDRVRDPGEPVRRRWRPTTARSPRRCCAACNARPRAAPTLTRVRSDVLRATGEQRPGRRTSAERWCSSR